MDSPARRAHQRVKVSPWDVGPGRAWLLVSLAVIRAVPSFDKIFKDFGSTALTSSRADRRHDLSKLAVHFWYCGIVLLLLLPLVHRSILSLLPPRPEAFRAANGVASGDVVGAVGGVGYRGWRLRPVL